MSERTTTYTRDFDPNDRDDEPTAVVEQYHRPPQEIIENVDDPETMGGIRRRALKIIATVGAIAAFSGVAGGVALSRRDHDGPEAKSPPAATAPASSRGEQLPTPSNTGEVLTHPYDKLTIDTFVYRLDGREYRGIGELQAAIELRVDKFQDSQNQVKIGELPQAFVDTLNLMVKAGAEVTGAEGYVSKDGTTKGVEGVCQDFISPALKAIVAEPNSSTNDFLSMIQSGQTGYTQLIEASKNTPTPYDGEFKIVSPSYIAARDTKGPVLSVATPFWWEDNQPGADQPRTNKRFEFRQFPGSNGSVWKLVRAADI